MRFASFVSLAILTACIARPAAADGWYFAAETGVSYAPTLSIGNTIAGANPAKVTTNLGLEILGQGGYAIGPFRLEEELGWRDNGINDVSTPAQGTGNGGGNLEPLSAMTNAYFDIATGSRFTPYVGAGIGAVDVMTNISQGGTTITNDSRVVLGYQGIAGLSYFVNDQLSLKADYHYLATARSDFSDNPSLGAGTAHLSYASHAILVGFIYHFGTVPPPMPEVMAPPKPAAAAAPAPAAAEVTPPAMPAASVPDRSFMVFFAFDKSDVTPEAHQIIEKAAEAAKTLGAARINLTGHTDTSGPEKYNMALSIRRAQAVKKVLMQLGISPDEISVVGKGKTDLLVPTPDGVREPRNRRVVIELP